MGMTNSQTPSEDEKLRKEVEQTFHHGPDKFNQNAFSHIKHVIGVVSGKGGVGKSLVCGLLACELSARKTKVAILDADITGPSIPKMFGLSGARIVVDPQREMMIPAPSAHGIKIVSTNLVLEHETDPVLWRGPILMGVLRQFWEEVEWGDVDYLLIDMPPGTGDVALTVFQQIPLDGIVIVTSPQDLVQMVVTKAVNMAQQMTVPVYGLIENMSYLVCPDCGRRIEPFGPSQLTKAAHQAGVEALGELPIDPALAASCDAGTIEDAAPRGLLSAAVDCIIETCAASDATKSS
jgi:Mrp family chromosome partitioning ATPase